MKGVMKETDGSPDEEVLRARSGEGAQSFHAFPGLASSPELPVFISPEAL